MIKCNSCDGLIPELGDSIASDEGCTCYTDNLKKEKQILIDEIISMIKENQIDYYMSKIYEHRLIKLLEKLNIDWREK